MPLTPSEILSRRLNERLAAVADDLTSILQATRGTPFHWLLNRARSRATDAVAGLIEVDPLDTAAIIRLQQDARQYTNLVEDIRLALRAGETAIQELNEQDRAELINEFSIDEEGD